MCEGQKGSTCREMSGSVIETEHEAINEFEYLEEEVNEEEEESWSSSDEEIGGALDYLDARDGSEGGIGGGGGRFTLQSSGRRPNAYGGMHSRPNNSTLQPLSNRTQKFANHIKASPLEVGNHNYY